MSMPNMAEMAAEDDFASFSTAAVHAGAEPDAWQQFQLVPCISLSSTYRKPSPSESACGVYDYSRTRNPTRDALQQSLSTIEAAKHCAVFSSGTAAIMAVVNVLHSGDHIICAESAYGGTHSFIKNIAVARHGLQVSFVDATKLEEIEKNIIQETKLVWVETVTNPLLHVHDIAAIVQLVKGHRKDILVLVDNTFLSPYFMRPLSLGADLVLHSLSKYINGHTDVIMGAVLTDSDELGRDLALQQKVVGAVPSAFDCFLVHRGIKTLSVRMRAHQENALAVAKALEKNSKVKKVLYPGLPSHPSHALHTRQSRGMSGMLAFYLTDDTAEAAKKFLTALKVVTMAASLGGVESLAEAPALSSAAPIPPAERVRLGISDGLIRLSVGLEESADLVADMEQALASL